MLAAVTADLPDKLADTMAFGIEVQVATVRLELQVAETSYTFPVSEDKVANKITRTAVFDPGNTEMGRFEFE